MPQTAPRIDAHCHLFNVFYLTSEIAEILWDKLWGNYPHRQKAFGIAGGVRPAGIRAWFDSLLKQISEVSGSAFNSYEENFNLLTAAYRKSFKTDEKLIVYPLMMDIRYMIADPCSAPPGAAPPPAEGPVAGDPQRVFDELFAELKDAVVRRRQETFPSQVKAMTALAVPLPDIDAGKTMDKIYAGIVHPPDQGFKAAVADGVELSKGCERQAWELMDLRKRHPDCVFPFFAVDPRRIGILEMVTKGRHFLPGEAPLVGKNGPFFGIKLYPRLGYLPVYVELQCPGPMMGAYIVNEANVRLLTDDYSGARRQMEEAIPLLPEGFALEVREMIEMIGAFEALSSGEPGGRTRMAAVWAGLRERQFYDSFDGHPAFRARLCALALAQHIEVDFVTSLIRKCGLAPPEPAPDAWPWPLRIHALGRFTIERDGSAVAAEGKGQRKPLELLRALVARGAMNAAQGLPTGELIDMLWPDLEADAPKASFDMSLMRLRKLLQVDGALRLAEGRLWLDPRLVWCDVAAFEQDCATLIGRPDHAQNSADDQACAAALRRLRQRQGLRLFGPGPVEPWSVLPRERLARRFEAAVVAHGARLEAQGAWITAIGLYEHGVAEDATAEPCHRGLMRCHLALHQPAAALRSFQRCRELLATLLKVPPSAETLALAARIPQAT